MSTAKRPSMPRYLRKPLIARAATPADRAPARPAAVLIRTVAFVPAYLRKRAH
jgi:hypothetical protein